MTSEIIRLNACREFFFCPSISFVEFCCCSSSRTDWLLQTPGRSRSSGEMNELNCAWLCLWLQLTSIPLKSVRPWIGLQRTNRAIWGTEGIESPCHYCCSSQAAEHIHELTPNADIPCFLGIWTPLYSIINWISPIPSKLLVNNGWLLSHMYLLCWRIHLKWYQACWQFEGHASMFWTPELWGM